MLTEKGAKAGKDVCLLRSGGEVMMCGERRHVWREIKRKQAHAWYKGVGSLWSLGFDSARPPFNWL
eukprot:3188246-Rhodomonas_salina.1